MICPACGTQNPDSAAFCGNCATRLIAATIQTPASGEQPPKKIRMGVILLSVILAFGIIAAGLIALIGLHDDNSSERTSKEDREPSDQEGGLPLPESSEEEGGLPLPGPSQEEVPPVQDDEPDTPEYNSNRNIDLNDYYNTFFASLGENVPYMMPADPDTLAAFYPGLSDIPTRQCVIYFAAMSAVAYEFALIECENEDDVEAVKALLKERKAYQVDGGAWYPETMEFWKNAQIIVRGNYVVLILAAEQTEDAVFAFNALFSATGKN